MSDCIFCRIVSGEIPAKKIYEDDLVVAFHDINPIAPVHFLVIPKVHVASMAELTDEHEAVMGRVMTVAGRLAREQGATDGFRTIINTGRVGRQEVYHLHVHILGGPEVLPAMLKR
ncbi:histidine triad nucleotide-binding protein [Thauera sp. CAU 1555]|jgi:histidine triad (HIT) family protein|uniref:Histidine triad nucleotide-binding protein n=1 Tax=Thauera sedimentorum TaxID=2767595 RepID=A0ABR9BGY5_9RHOO|nr:histidine triad nucleotide-binding protein [Thauera sedimentorum]MBC9073582.1 histidine triad nucleotide-binding protein [Thauera sedimentorum]MBD8504501.1 histidine triad nucleotide-binding protein [Thauera sedimentorum]